VVTLGSGCGCAARRGGSGEGDDMVAGLSGGSCRPIWQSDISEVSN